MVERLNSWQSDAFAVITGIQVGVNTGNTALAALQATADGIQTGVTGANGKLDTALASLTSAQTKLDTLQTSVDALAGSTTTFQALSVRMQIEANLAHEENRIVALFALPAAQGGYFQTTRAIVLEVIQMTQASGQSVGLAPALLARGDQLASQNNFKEAYVSYGRAYRAAARTPGGF